MEQEIGNISIALIRKLNPAMKGIGNDFIMDSTEYYIPDVNSIFKYPLRLDGIIIAVRKQGSATININLREYNTTKNDLILCAPGDILQSIPKPGMHQTQMFLISSDFLKEMYINLNSFMPFFISLKENPKFHLTEEEVQELKSFYQLIEETVSRNDNFKTEIVRRLMGAYLYKIGSILHRRQPEFLSENPNLMNSIYPIGGYRHIHQSSKKTTLLPFPSVHPINTDKGKRRCSVPRELHLPGRIPDSPVVLSILWTCSTSPAQKKNPIT